MKLAAKLIIVIFLVLAVLLAVDGFVAMRRETQLFQDDMKRDARVLGNTLKNFVADAWETAGAARVSQLLSDANRDQHVLQVRWIALHPTDAKGNRAMASSSVLAPLATGHEVITTVPDQHGRHYLCTYVPVSVHSQTVGAIEVSESLAQLNRFKSANAYRTLVLAAVLMLAGGATAMLMGVTLIGRPLHQLAVKAKQVGQGDLTPSLDPRGTDELAELARSMNTMCWHLADARQQTLNEQERRIAAIEQLRQADRLRTVGRLAAGIAHELGTPLNTISIRSGMIAAHELPEAEVIDSARIIKQQSQRMTSLIRELLDYARPRPPVRAAVNVVDVVHDTIKMLAPLSDKQKAKISLSSSSSNGVCSAMADASQIQQVLTNLFVNALHASTNGSPVRVNVEHVAASRPGSINGAENYVCISVADQGPGIPAENLDHIFEPFFTTKDVGEGTGLGLSIAHEIVQEHDGWIAVTSQPGEGSCFKVYIPVV